MSAWKWKILPRNSRSAQVGQIKSSRQSFWVEHRRRYGTRTVFCMSYSSFCGNFCIPLVELRPKVWPVSSWSLCIPAPCWPFLHHEMKRSPPITWPKGSGYPILLLHGATPALLPQGDEAGLIMVINVFLPSGYSVPEGILWVWYMSHGGMQQNFLALQLWRYSIHLLSAHKTCSPETWWICFAEAQAETPGKYLESVSKQQDIHFVSYTKQDKPSRPPYSSFPCPSSLSWLTSKVSEERNDWGLVFSQAPLFSFGVPSLITTHASI